MKNEEKRNDPTRQTNSYSGSNSKKEVGNEASFNKKNIPDENQLDPKRSNTTLDDLDINNDEEDDVY